MLGTGTSHGVPMIGCRCATCRSTDPRDRRLRPSIYVDIPEHASILVDTATDLRQQALEFIEDDELVEVTPKEIRLRKRFLTESDRKKASRQVA